MANDVVIKTLKEFSVDLAYSAVDGSKIKDSELKKRIAIAVAKHIFAFGVKKMKKAECENTTFLLPNDKETIETLKKEVSAIVHLKKVWHSVRESTVRHDVSMRDIEQRMLYWFVNDIIAGADTDNHSYLHLVAARHYYNSELVADKKGDEPPCATFVYRLVCIWANVIHKRVEDMLSEYNETEREVLARAATHVLRTRRSVNIE